MTIGRNDPCRCGSGEKYKKCCLKNEGPSENELFQMRFARLHSALNDLLLDYVGKTYGSVACQEAWDEFHLWEDEEGFDPESDELQIFMPWFFYDWTPDGSESEVPATLSREMTPSEYFLKAAGSKLDPVQREYVELCTKAGSSFFEILEIWPERGIEVEDLLTGDVENVFDKQASTSLRKGCLTFGKMVTIQGLTMLESVSSFEIPPEYKIKVMELRKYMKAQNRVITRDVIWEYNPEIQQVYQAIVRDLVDPAPPMMVNGNGEPIIPHTLTYDLFAEPEAVLDALVSLNSYMTKESIIEHAELADGKLKRVEFTWTEKLKKPKGGFDTRNLGHIVIDNQVLVVEVNSEKRANKFEALMKKRLAGGYKLRHRVVESLEQAGFSRDLNDRSEREALMKDPEVREQITAYLKAHWDGWISERIPALGNKTPLQAAKTKAGREALDALLTQFELEQERKPLDGLRPETFREIRKKLGI